MTLGFTHSGGCRSCHSHYSRRRCLFICPQIGQLSEDYSQLAVVQGQAPNINVNWSDPFQRLRTDVVEVVDEFIGYYGDQPIPSLLGVQGDATPGNASVTLIEVSTLRFIARILSMSEGEPATGPTPSPSLIPLLLSSTRTATRTCALCPAYQTSFLRSELNKK